MSVNTDVIDVCLMDFADKVLAETNVELRERSVDQALGRVRDEQGARALPDETFLGVGLGIAGLHVSGTSFNASLPLHEWSLIELCPLLTRFLDRPVWALNGDKTGTVAESMFGVGRYIKDFAYLSFNYGFGGGLIWNGELLHGGNGNAGEFSQMYDDEEVNRRPTLQLVMETLKAHGVDVPSITYLRKHFDPTWPGVAGWLDRVTPAYNRLLNAIWVSDKQTTSGKADDHQARLRHLIFSDCEDLCLRLRPAERPNALHGISAAIAGSCKSMATVPTASLFVRMEAMTV